MDQKFSDMVSQLNQNAAPNLKGIDTVGGILSYGGFNLITFVFFIAGLIFLVNLISAAWEYLSSTGDSKKIAGATTRIVNAFFGIMIVLGSFIIVRIVITVLGFGGLF